MQATWISKLTGREEKNTCKNISHADQYDARVYISNNVCADINTLLYRMLDDIADVVEKSTDQARRGGY